MKSLFLCVVLASLVAPVAAYEPSFFGRPTPAEQIAALERQQELLVCHIERLNQEIERLRQAVRWTQDPTMLDAEPYAPSRRPQRYLRLPYRHPR